MYEGGIYSSEWFWSKILHTLKVDASVREAAFSWVEHCDWIAGELCGRTDPLTMSRSRCAAGHKALWHASWGGLPPEEFLAGVDPLLAGLRSRLYTDTDTADVPVGTLSAKWAAKLGLPESVVVSGTAFDCHFGAVGAQIQPYELVKVVGTSTCDILVAPDVDTCVRGICGQVDGSVVPGLIGLEAGQSAFGDVYAWFKRLLGYAGDISLPRLEREAAEIAPGSTGIVALDWFNGRRTPDANPHLRGGVFGLNLGSTAPMVYRALAESTVFGARRIVERFREEGVPVKSVSAIGGIARKSTFVMIVCIRSNTKDDASDYLVNRIFPSTQFQSAANTWVPVLVDVRDGAQDEISAQNSRDEITANYKLRNRYGELILTDAKGEELQRVNYTNESVGELLDKLSGGKFSPLPPFAKPDVKESADTPKPAAPAVDSKGDKVKVEEKYGFTTGL